MVDGRAETVGHARAGATPCAGCSARWSWAGASLFIALGWIRQERYATFSFDLGIYDQAVWLLSRFHDPFVTVRGLEFFGHHVNPILLLFVPFYWLGAGPLFLLVGPGGGAGVGRDRDLPARPRPAPRPLARRSRWPRVLLLNPTYQWLTWEFFHPDALAIAPLLFAYWAARDRRAGSGSCCSRSSPPRARRTSRSRSR